MGAGFEALFVVLLVIGVIQCFFGYKIFRFLTAVIGFVVGGVIGAAAGLLAAGQVGALCFALIVGVLGALLAYKLYKLGVFIVCFGAGAVLGGALGMIAGSSNMIVAFAGIAGLVLGVLGVILTKPIIILSTSVGGGMSAGMALGMMMSSPGSGLALGIVLAICGILLQFYLDKKRASAGEEAGQGEEKGPGFQMPALPKLNGDSAGEGLKNAFASLKTGAAGLGRKVGSGAQSVANSQTVRQFRGVIDNTKTVHPLSGWNELAREEHPLWAGDLPIVVNEARIAAPAAGDGVYLALGFQNLSGREILGVFFTVKCYDLLKQELEGIEKLAVQDFRLAPGELWFSEQPFALPDKDTRRVELTVKNVVFAGGDIWSNETGTVLAPVEEQSALDLPPELASELFRECRAYLTGYDPAKIFRFQPQDYGDSWYCACGQLNLGEACMICGIGKEPVFDLARPERLSEIREARLAEQKRLEEERRQKIAEQTEAAKQKAAEVSAKTAETLKKGLDKGAELGKQTGDALNKGLNKGTEWSRQTGEKLKAFWAEKIEPNKRNIAIVACVFAAVLAVLLGTLFGLRAYRTSQEEKALIQAEQEAEERRRQAEEERKAAMELAEWEAQYLFPYSDKEPIDENALEDMSETDLELAKYEILARHGRVFSTQAYAEHFTARPWYVPNEGFDENAANALSEVERANIALIDRVLAGRKNAQAAQALLNKLGEYSSRLTVQNATPVDGVYFALSNPGSYDDSLRQVNWSEGGTVNTTMFSGLLCAKVTDLDHNGTPELVTISLGYYGGFGYYNGDICIEFWAYDGQQVVPFADKVYAELMMPGGSGSSGELFYQSGDDKDVFHMVTGAFDFGSSFQKDTYISTEGKTVLQHTSSDDSWMEDLENTTGPVDTFYIDGQEVSQGDYQQKKDSLSQGGTSWFNSYIDSNYWAEATLYNMSGGLYLNGPKEIAEAEAYLTQMANG